MMFLKKLGLTLLIFIALLLGVIIAFILSGLGTIIILGVIIYVCVDDYFLSKKEEE